MLFVDIVLPVFLVVLCGYLLEKKFGLDFRPLTTCSLYLFSPALVFSALFERPLSLDLAGTLLAFMVLYTAALLGLAAVLGRILHLQPDVRNALSLTTAMMNVGNFGLPLAYFAFGEPGLEVSVLTFVIFNIPLGTVAIYIAQGGSGNWLSMSANTLRIPIFHAVVLAFALRWFDLSVPDFLLRPIALLGQAAIPLMLVLLGMQLARTRLVREPTFLSLATLLRLGLAPMLAWLLTGWLGMSGLARSVVILQTSTPSAVLPLLYSLRFNSRPDLVAGAIFTTTLLSAVTLTLLLHLLP